ncbi:hypothetical protein O9993_19220 [Vibrio lentus]|nr:hypothetical protein [Vibrio lentus]
MVASLGTTVLFGPVLHLAKRSIRSSSKRSMQSTVAGTNRQNMANELSSKIGVHSALYCELLVTGVSRKPTSVKFRFLSRFCKAVIPRFTISLAWVQRWPLWGWVSGLSFEEVMTPGGLIASMLISKVTGPAQMLATRATF